MQTHVIYNTQLVIADTDEWDFLIECNTRQANTFIRHHLLHTNRLVLIHINVEHKDLAVGGKGCQNGAGVWGPFNVTNTRTQIEYK